MGSEPIVLAVDHGTSGIKASLVSVRGRILSSTFVPTPTRFLEGGGAEQDPEDWWRALVKASGVLFSRHPEWVPRVVSVSVSSTFSTTVAVDAQGRHLGPALTWMDSRGAPLISELMGGFPKVAGYGLGKILRWVPITGGGPSLSGKDDIAHVLYWKETQPALYEKTRAFLPSKDYLNLRLTGISAASYDSMTLFWLSDIRDPFGIRYDDGLIKSVGIHREKLPEMRPSAEILGPLSAQAALELGLPTSVKVPLGSPDHQCAGIGAGCVRDFDGHLYVGTSSWVQCIVPFKKTDVLHSIASLPTAIPGRYFSANEQDMAGGSLDFLRDLLFSPLLGPELRAARERGFEVLDNLAAEAPAGSGGLLFLPWLNGERTPVDDRNLRGGLVNLATTTSVADLVRSVYEGVAFNTRWNLDYTERFVGRRMNPLAIVGGGALCDTWCQIFSDVMQRTIRRVVDPKGANARGAALIASVALGQLRFEEIPDLVEVDRVFEPGDSVREVYERQFEAFLRFHRRNRSWFRWMNQK